MSGYTDLDVLAIHRCDFDSRAIDLDRALEGAFIDAPVRGIGRRVRAARGRANLDWSRSLHRSPRRLRAAGFRAMERAGR